MAKLAYQIDPVHTMIAFSVRHMMVSNVRGEFTRSSGTIVFDTENLADSSIDIVVETASIQTNNSDRDTHLRSADFLDVANHPEMHFRSRKIEPKGKLGDWTEGKITGDLTIRGVTSEITLNVEGPQPEIIDPYGKRRVGASATARLSRKVFGLTYNPALEAGGVVVGDEVKITIDVEAVRE